ncbi:MAG: cupin domain-containing protein [Myxococcota bacterium]
MKIVRWDRSAQRFSSEKLQKVGLFASDRFLLDLYCLEPGQSQRPHTHPGSEKVYLVQEGVGRFRIGDEERSLGPGEAVRAAPGELHGVTNASEQRLVVLTLMAPPPEPA